MFFKIQWSPVLIVLQNVDNKNIFKNLEQQFMSVIKLIPNLCTTNMEFCKNFERRDRETDKNARNGLPF